jgi:excisionase family DNA binding protein
MEVITIENKAFQELSLKIDHLHEFVRSVQQKKEEKKDVWLDSKAVCDRLSISARTLYRLKKERQIGYSSLRGHCRFKLSDVEQILQERQVASHPETFEEQRQTIKK